METFSLRQVQDEVTSIGKYLSAFCSSSCGIGAEFNTRTFDLVSAAHSYVYGREALNPDLRVDSEILSEFLEYLSELGEMFEVFCGALYDLTEKFEVYIKYDEYGHLNLEEIATLLNTTEEHLEALEPGKLFYVCEEVYCEKSPYLANDPRFVRV